MSEREDELVANAVDYLIERSYPEGCTSNKKRIVRRKAATLVLRDGDVFYKKSKKYSAGEKVLNSFCLRIYILLYMFI